MTVQLGSFCFYKWKHVTIWHTATIPSVPNTASPRAWVSLRDSKGDALSACTAPWCRRMGTCCITWAGSSAMRLHSRLATGSLQAPQTDKSTLSTWRQFYSTLAVNHIGFFLHLALCFLFLASLVFWQCEIPWRFSPEEFVKFLPSDICSGFSLQFHLAEGLSVVTALFQLLGEKSRAAQAVFWLLLSTAIYKECNGTKHSNLFFELNLLWHFSTRLNEGLFSCL